MSKERSTISTDSEDSKRTSYILALLRISFFIIDSFFRWDRHLIFPTHLNPHWVLTTTQSLSCNGSSAANSKRQHMQNLVSATISFASLIFPVLTCRKCTIVLRESWSMHTTFSNNQNSDRFWVAAISWHVRRIRTYSKKRLPEPLSEKQITWKAVTFDPTRWTVRMLWR